MSGYENRKSKGIAFENDVTTTLDGYGIKYWRTGSEHLTGTAATETEYRFSKPDTTAQFVCHYPDLALVSKDAAALLEIKGSTGIERECYRNYQRLSGLGLNVLLCLKSRPWQYQGRDPKALCLLGQLRLKPPSGAKDGFCLRGGVKVPVDDSVWINPYKLSDGDLRTYRRNTKGATSGSCYALFDFESTPLYPFVILQNMRLNDVLVQLSYSQEHIFP